MVRGSKKYKDIPIYAAPGLHEECFAIISDVCQQGAKILDIAASAGAFAARLKDANITDAASRAIFLRKGLFYHFSPNSFMQTGHMTILPYWLLEILIRSVNLEIALFKFGGEKERGQNLKGVVFSLITNFLHVFMKSSQHNELKSNYII